MSMFNPRAPRVTVSFVVIVFGILALVTAAPTTRAELIIGLTSQNTLISFDSATPGTISTIGSIAGAGI